MKRGERLLPELERLAAEVETVYRSLVLEGWTGPQHGLPDTLYGYMMGAFARVDLYSAHWQGSSASQSKRMVSFMSTYMHADRFANSIAVHFWRHKLMHTASPRPLRNTKTGTTHLWLLHWGDEHLPRDQHFKFQAGDKVLNLSLVGFVADLRIALGKYLGELAVQSDLQIKYDAAAKDLENYELIVF
jgi:hypothetical protein